MPVKNQGRQINYISGINGVSPNGQAILNLPCNMRYHRIILNVTEAGVAAAVTSIITSVKIIVNGIPIRDITPANILKIAQAQGYFPVLGELPILFTEPFNTAGNINEPDDVLAWDLAGQSTFSIQLGIKNTTVTPGVQGIYEFDYQRNQLPDGSLFLQPVAHREFSLPIVTGRNDITILPFSFPIRRMWLQGSTPGQILDYELYQDGNKVHEATVLQTRQAYRQYGFRFNSTPDATPFRNATGPADLALSALLEAANYFDSAYVSDPDGRYWRALRIDKAMLLRVNSGAAQTLTVVQETMPGAFVS